MAPIIGNKSEFTCNDACSILSTADDIADTLVSIVVTLSLSLVLASSRVVPNPCMSVCNVSSSSDAVVKTSFRVIICLEYPPPGLEWLQSHETVFLQKMPPYGRYRYLAF